MSNEFIPSRIPTPPQQIVSIDESFAQIYAEFNASLLEDFVERTGIPASELDAGATIFYPDLFAALWLKTDLWEQQRDILHAIATKPRVAVKACHSSGKTHLAARAVLWFLAKYERSTVVTTAPTWGQVERLLWGEIHGALKYSRYPFPKALNVELKIDHERYAYGLSTSVTKSDEGVKFQGIHNHHLLMILDEAPGVDPKIWTAIEGNRAGGDVHILAIGNPTISSGPFHDAFTRNRENWECFTISAFDTPNLKGVAGFGGDQLDKNNKVLAGSKLETLLKMKDEDLDDNPRSYLTGRRWVKERFKEWGPGHPLWDARVEGKFPKQDEHSLISLAWLEEAKTDRRSQEKPPTGRVNAGIDVAGPGEAETSLTIRQGPRILLHKQWPISDPRGELVACLAPYRDLLEAVNVDAVGIGWYVFKHLEDLGFPAVPIIAQAAPSDSEAYKDVKAELYWGLRLRIKDGDFSGLVDEVTIGQLSGIRYKHNARGQVEIESKEKARERTGGDSSNSPDRAESVMLAFGTMKLCYGVLELNKQQNMEEEVKKTQAASQIAKVLQPDNAQSCPVCSAKCVIPCQNGLRCNQCGHQFFVGERIEQKPQKRDDLMIKGARSGRLF